MELVTPYLISSMGSMIVPVSTLSIESGTKFSTISGTIFMYNANKQMNNSISFDFSYSPSYAHVFVT